MLKQKIIKFGMVGGGLDSTIGDIHRMAAGLNGMIELVAGAFSSDPKKSYAAGAALHLDPNRVYGSYKEMLQKEKNLPESERIDFVTIVTPNFLHFSIAKDFIDAGFNIVCDKPITTTIQDAEKLCSLVKAKGIIFAVTYNLTGFTLVKQAKELVKDGLLGKIRKVNIEYHQGGMSTLLEKQGVKATIWRTDPKKTGTSYVVADIGSHAENLVSYITGLEIEEIFADFTTFVPGRKLEDDCSMLIHFSGGARGVFTASTVLVGERNNVRIKVYGTRASMEWNIEDPKYLYIRYGNKPKQVYESGLDYLKSQALDNTIARIARTDGFLGAFASIYISVAKAIIAKKSGKDLLKSKFDFPTVEDGARGVQFINKAVESAKSGKWVKFEI